MKAIKLIATVVFAGAIFYQAQQKQESATNISLNEVEALAQNESGTEKVYDYTIWENDPCKVLIGNTIVPGKRVSCFSGNTYTDCVDCKI